MKSVHLLAAAALALAPAAGIAQSTTGQETGAQAIEPGGVSQTGAEALPVFALGSIPAGAIVVGGVVILSGVIIGVVAATEDDSTPVSTTSTP